eukprot:scaffold349827_cov63-Attheya_sp.AAC.1
MFRIRISFLLALLAVLAAVAAEDISDSSVTPDSSPTTPSPTPTMSMPVSCQYMPTARRCNADNCATCECRICPPTRSSLRTAFSGERGSLIKKTAVATIGGFGVGGFGGLYLFKGKK